MFLNIIFPGSKTWKPYWVEVSDCYLDISVEYGKSAFTSYHLGVMKVRPSKDHADRPDVLEFYSEAYYTNISFYVFTYDPFDILDFFKNITNAHKMWNENVSKDKIVLTHSCEVKTSGFFSTSYTWSVGAEEITITKKGTNESSVVRLTDISNVTPSHSSSHVAYFKYTNKSSADAVEHRCSDLTSMKKLLNAIYTNKCILKLYSGEGSLHNE